MVPVIAVVLHDNLSAVTGTCKRLTTIAMHCKNKRVDVTHLGLFELHNNVHISRLITFLEHYIGLQFQTEDTQLS